VNSTVSRGLVLVVLITCTMLLLWWFVPGGEDTGGWRVTAVRSGDLITVERDGVTATVHLLGITAPSSGQCGFEESRDYLDKGIAGTEVDLIADGDGPDQLVWERYVELSRRDAGLEQIRSGHAVPDGAAHSRAEAYEAAAVGAPAVCEG